MARNICGGIVQKEPAATVLSPIRKWKSIPDLSEGNDLFCEPGWSDIERLSEVEDLGSYSVFSGYKEVTGAIFRLEVPIKSPDIIL